MNRLKEIKQLKELAEKYRLDGREIIEKYNMQELCSIYNGIGPDAFPEWLRKGISALNPSLAVVAFIHDIEWHESDGSMEAFTASNERFRANGFKVADAENTWWSPRRWMVRHQAAKFARLCQKFGWRGWSSPCNCAVCRKKAAKESGPAVEKAVGTIAEQPPLTVPEDTAQ